RNDYRVHTVSGEASQPASNCAAAGTAACHENGVCRDYTDGFCCECQAGYYGNGKDCEKKGEPQRISGSLEGVINGLIRSYTGMDVQLKEHGQPRSMRMTIDQQIQYEECPHRP
ncbi:hypothetical protein TELCIR_19980, partial [Teladorsagia circumcincta]